MIHLLDLAAALIVALGLAHSYLGERYLLQRLFRREDLPRLFGSAEFTRRTLRFAWHVTSVAWLGLAAVLVLLARPPLSARSLGLAVGLAFLVQGVIALAGSRGRHLSWPIFLAVGILAIFATRGGTAATPATDARVAAALVAELTRQAEQWDSDIVRKRPAAIAANMAEDFRQIGSDGSVADKAAFLRDITSPDLVIDPYTVEDFDVRVYGTPESAGETGDVALLSGRTRMTGRFAGKPFATHYRYIDTYVRRDGRWQVVSVQTTPVREAAAD